MSTFTFTLPTRVIFGSGAIEMAGPEGVRLGSRAFVVTGSDFARRSGIVERLGRSLADEGMDVTIYDRLDQNPAVEDIDDAADAAREAGAQVVVGLGGGSALDAAKAVALTASSDTSVWERVQHGRGPSAAPIGGTLPLIQVPLIASTGSETNNIAVIYNRSQGVKVPVSDPSLFARVAIVDPTLTFTVPARYTAVGAMNIVSQMLESYLTSDEFAVTDRVTEGLVRVVMDSLARAMRQGEDLDARTNLSWAATMATTVALAGRAGSTPLRALTYPLTARFPVEHGTAVAALWASFMRYALANRLRLPQIGRFKRYALLGRQLFGVHETDDEVAAEITIYRYVSWLRSTGMPTDFRALGVDPSESDLAALAEQAVVVSGNGRRLPSGLTAEDIQNIYQGALRPL